MHKHREIYSSLEIRDNSLNFVVVLYDEFGEYNVLFEKHLTGHYSNNGIIDDNFKTTVKELRKIIDEVNDSLNINIKKVGLVLPNENLNILKHIVNKKYDKLKEITAEEIIKLKNSTEQLYVPKDHIIAFIKPYLYIVDDLEKTKQLLPPIGKKINSLMIKSLVYTIDKTVYLSHIEVLKAAKLQSLSITIKSFSLGWSTGIKNLHKGVIIVDWNENSLDINIFIKQTLVQFKSFKKFGINNFINSLEPMFKTNPDNIRNYLYRVLNHEVLFDTKDFIIYKNIDENNRLIKVSMKEFLKEFTNFCNIGIKKINEYLDKYFNSEKKEEYKNIIFTGEILNVNVFENIVEEKDIPNAKLYISNIIGIQDVWSIPIIGNIFYQHIVNKMNNNLITSV